MKLRFLLYTSACLLLLSSFFSCSDEVPQPEPDGTDDSVNRTVLVYMAADNNLSKYAYGNIDKMLEGAAGHTLNGGNLLVYFDPADDAPQLYQIKAGEDGKAVKTVVKTYEEQNSVSPEVMRSVIDEVVSEYPADNYGLILWSHGTAWFPEKFRTMLRSFGDDNERVMEIDQLKEALPDQVFDFILFDACYMASTEVIYALREKADYIIGSPTETMAEGFPYKKILTPMFQETPDFEGICREFYNYYDVLSGFNRSATVSLAATAPMEKLAQTVKAIVKGKEEAIYNLPISELQQLEHLTASKHALYDLDDFISRLATPKQYTTFRQCLDEVILYKQATPFATYAKGPTQLAINHFSGLSIYVPQTALSSLTAWYKGTDWYKAVYAE